MFHLCFVRVHIFFKWEIIFFTFVFTKQTLEKENIFNCAGTELQLKAFQYSKIPLLIIFLKPLNEY